MPRPAIFFAMIKAGKLLVSTLSGILICGSVGAATADSTGASTKESSDRLGTDGNPYHGIVDRNVFGLKDPPPPPPPNPDAGKPPTPPITLTGITTVLGNKRAFLTLQLPAKAPEPAKIASLMLTEGQRDGEVEVLEIDEKERTVKV